MLVISSNNNQLKIETAESAKYISNIEYHASGDTTMLEVKTTTVFNPFSEKEYYKVIALKPVTKFIKIGSTVQLASKFENKRVLF